MKRRYPLWMSSVSIAALSIMGASSPAVAQFRCDCTSIVDSCEATVAISGNWVEITSDHAQCSRVDYFIDGQPFVSVAVDGQDRQEWIPRATAARVLVQSCQVCRDSGAAAQTAEPESDVSSPGPDGTGSEEDPGLAALIEVAPTYPDDALARGLAGYVELQVTVGPAGNVQDASVTSSDPADVFDQAALAAVRRWRYREDREREPQTVTERIEFDPRMVRAAASDDAAAPAPANVTPSEVRNACVREGRVFNYGNRIDVELVNACDAPVLVFGCAEGTGGYRGRWVCTTSEQQRNLLVQQDDRRVGETTPDPADEAVALTYTDQFSMSRAPNSEYWWLACGLDDQQCRANGVQWTRSMDKQLSSVDPQGRSSVSVARSY